MASSVGDMTREQLEGLGLTDQELTDEYHRIFAGEFVGRVKKISLRGKDTRDRQGLRGTLYGLVAESWFRDPGLPE